MWGVTLGLGDTTCVYVCVHVCMGVHVCAQACVLVCACVVLGVAFEHAQATCSPCR